jgi:hypothetical protein
MGDSDVLAALATQREHQLRVARARQPWWIPWLFVLGACVSIFGVMMSLQAISEDGVTVRLGVFALFTLLFGWVVVLWLIAPLFIRPRIVPYFARELGPYGGHTMVAFRRGRAFYREIVALEGLARTVGVTPFSAFGFTYDHYEQAVRWHPAASGLQSVETVRRALAPEVRAMPDVADDLEALADVLRAAAEQGVDFCLVLRLHATESMQAVCTREVREGSFW